ncbi:MAG: hypothetical protein Q9222_001747 [Ikaeria aurantiellina]
MSSRTSQSDGQIDIELGQPSASPASQAPLSTRLTGYPSFAHYIAKDADAAIYRKFEGLSARNLLYLQSELHELEGQLEELDIKDAKQRDEDERESRKIARLWPHFARASNERAIKHREIQAEIQVKLKAYHKALILESRVLKLSAPTPRGLKVFRRWFQSSPLPVLCGRDKDLFRDEQDLVALAPVETDRLHIFLQNYFGWFFKEKLEDDAGTRDSDIFYFPARRVQRAGAVISIILSAILLIGAIVCLVKVERQNTDLRVGLIVLFTCIFAAVVGLLTNARRAEIFAATAA